MTALGRLHNRHAGKKILVCGLGPSLSELMKLNGNQPVTIGVNDIHRYMPSPVPRIDYHILLDRPETFGLNHHRDESFRHICETKVERMTLVGAFHEQWQAHIPSAVHMFMVGVRPLPEKLQEWHDAQAQVHKGYSGGSPYTGVSLAGFLGATSIGLLGVDLVDHPTINVRDLENWRAAYAHLEVFLRKKGIAIWNLSPKSAITTIPSRSIEDWLKG